MGQILDSDWSRKNLLRSDWLVPRVALYTTIMSTLLNQYNLHYSRVQICLVVDTTSYSKKHSLSGYFVMVSKGTTFSILISNRKESLQKVDCPLQ